MPMTAGISAMARMEHGMAGVKLGSARVEMRQSCQLSTSRHPVPGAPASLVLDARQHFTPGTTHSPGMSYVCAIALTRPDAAHPPQRVLDQETTMTNHNKMLHGIRGFFLALVREKAMTAPRLSDELGRNAR
ncbi:hypothetical protein A7A09_017435 [Paracoccus methylarcula]|uniref:Uncharacterized protein n=1 Tax=Paracoccus methylarcula TaxID=72022 RepID=A0A3R7LIK8_9RHOB|nr:hypothetical protein A7A09_017435 [Paracoccus methylarcula]